VLIFAIRRTVIEIHNDQHHSSEKKRPPLSKKDMGAQLQLAKVQVNKHIGCLENV